MQHAHEVGRGPQGPREQPASGAETTLKSSHTAGKDAPGEPARERDAECRSSVREATSKRRRPRIDVITADELDAELETAWRDLQAAGPDLAGPFFSLAFCRIVAQARDDPRVAIVSDDTAPSVSSPTIAHVSGVSRLWRARSPIITGLSAQSAA